MKAQLKAYAFFIGFAVLTKAVIVPLAKQVGIPFVSDL